MKPGWPRIDAAKIADTIDSLKSMLVQPTSRALVELQAMLTGGLTFTDNFKCAIVKRDLVHGAEQLVTLGFRPIGVYALRSEAIGDGARYGISSLDWRMDAPGGTIGVTARFDQFATGYIGERVSSFLVRSSATALVNNTAKTVTSITLTAGDWDISFGLGATPATTATYFQGGVSTTTNTMPTTDQYGDRAVASLYNLPNDTIISLAGYRVNSAATYYLVAQAGFTAGSTSAYGRISAVRATKYDTAAKNTVTLLCVGG